MATKARAGDWARLLRSRFVLHFCGGVVGCFPGVSRGFLRFLLRGFHRLVGGCFCVGGSLFCFFLGGFHSLCRSIGRGLLRLLAGFLSGHACRVGSIGGLLLGLIGGIGSL